MRKILVLTALLIGLTIPSLALADFDAAADFSPSVNPTSVWSYGQAATLGGPFSLYTFTENTSGVDFWGAAANPLGNPPDVFHNGTNQVVVISTITIQPGQLAFHPGPENQYSVIRFTAPASGTFQLSSAFTAIDFTTTDVHILRNSLSLFNGIVDFRDPGPNFSSALILGAGDTLDFEVGFGSNNTYNNDSTAISVHISQTSSFAVPEAGSVSLLGFALLVIGVVRRRAYGYLPITAARYS